MKRIIFSAFLCIFCSLDSFSQNVGVGNANPQARLDIAKPGGDTPTLNIRGSVNVSQFNFGTNEDTYIRGGKSSSHLILNDNGSGRVGIGMGAPGFPLNFAGVTGDKISLYGNTGAHYGFGIQNGQLQIHTDGASSDILFGYGSSNSFTERMRIKGNGNIGLGTNAPVNRLDIAGLNNWDLVNSEGDMRIGTSQYRLKFGVALAGGGVGAAGIMQSGGVNLLSIGSNNSYQLQINGADNSVSISNNALLKFTAALSKKIIFYPGSVGDANIGVFANELRISSDYSGADITFGYDNRSSGFTEKFRLKATGAFSVNGNVGASGQVLSSNGSSSAPTWSSSTNALFNSTVQLLSGQIEPANNTDVVVPGLSYTFTASGNCKVLVMPTISIFAFGCALCGDTYCNLKVFLDGAIAYSWIRNANNGQYDSISGSCILNVGAGAHTIEIKVIAIGPSVRFGPNNPTVIQIIQQ